MAHYVGLDIHKAVVEAVIVDGSGALVRRARFACSREQIERFAALHLHADDQVAVEATTTTWPIVDLLKPRVASVVVSNPLRTRAIADAKIKTDKVDALVLAQLLRADYLPPVWQPDSATRTLRLLTSRRAALVADRIRLKNRLHSELAQRLIPLPEGLDDLFSVPGRQWLAELTAELDPVAEAAVASTLRLRTRQSAHRTYHGPITRTGNSHARWVLVQAAQHVGRHPGPLGHSFRRLARRKGRNVAVVAIARKLVVIAWHMLTSNEPYRYAEPRTTAAKLGALRMAATGQRRRKGVAKGTPPSEYHGRGGVRRIPSLATVCAAEGVPAPRPLSRGEQRVVEACQATEYVQRISTSHCVPLMTIHAAAP
jgi:transposase